MKRLKVIAAVLMFLLPKGVSAQFYTTGEDPARLKWRQAEWPHIRIVYPEGLDSLAYVYGSFIEEYRIPVSRSTGLIPNKGFKNKLPLVLHPYSGTSNALVAWAPRRMEFYTLGDPYDPEASSWERHLSIHESRHVSQMMIGYTGKFKPLRWITGDALPIAMSALYSGNFIMEGDAVVAETGLTDSGRGRDGDFLNHYHSAFNADYYRSWQSWRHGSWRHYTPTYYALGYMLIAGTRVFYDDPLLMRNVYGKITGKPFSFNSVRKEIKSLTGLGFKDSWNLIAKSYQEMWNESAKERGPFISSEFVTEIPSWYEDYTQVVFTEDEFLVVREGLLESAALGRISEDGSFDLIRQFRSSSSPLAFDPNKNRIYWSETFNNPRWNHAATSRIRYMDLSSCPSKRAYKLHNLTREGRLYNPVPSPDGSVLAAVDYRYLGGTSLVIIDADSGEELWRKDAPSGLQLTIPAWHNGGIAVAGLSEEGMGIYFLAGLEKAAALQSSAEFQTLLAPATAKIGGLRQHGSELVFSSDRSGVNEIYAIRDGKVLQLTSTEYGASNAVFHGDSLYFVTQETGLPLYNKSGEKYEKKYGEGRLLHRAAASDLLYSEVDYSDVRRDYVADKLSAQEQALAEAGIPSLPNQRGKGSEEVSVDLSGYQPSIRKYSKLAHIPRFHSWVPFSMVVDDFNNLNFNQIMEDAGIGATAVFQNDLGTASGLVSYTYNGYKDVDYDHQGHFTFIYKGLYPAFEFDIDVGSRSAVDYTRTVVTDEYYSSYYLSYSKRNKPYVDGSIRVYLPLKFNSGGLLRGVTPSVEYCFSNDIYNKGILTYDYSESLFSSSLYSSHRSFTGITEGGSVYLQTLNASVNGYIMQSTPDSREYPRLGIGAQAGYHQRIGLSDTYSAGVYGYLYGYLPGLFRTQGLKLTSTFQHTFDADYGEDVIDIRPRGFENDYVDTFLSYYTDNQLKLTADYAIQIWMGDSHWYSDLLHITHMVLTPHFDWLGFSYRDGISGSNGKTSGSIYTAGVDIAFHMSNILWFPLPGRIGVTLNLNGGPSLSDIRSTGISAPDHYIGLVFSLDL